MDLQWAASGDTVGRRARNVAKGALLVKKVNSLRVILAIRAGVERTGWK